MTSELSGQIWTPVSRREDNTGMFHGLVQVKKDGFADDASDEANPVARFAMNTEMSTILGVVATDVPMRNSDAVRKKSMEREGKRPQDLGWSTAQWNGMQPRIMNEICIVLK